MSRAIEKKALRLLRKHGVTKPEVPVERIAEAEGAILRYLPTEDDVSGMLYREVDGRAVIGINQNHHPNRRRFTLAHELGHLLLHESSLFLDTPRNTVRLRNERSASGTDREEVQANKFAAALLMPDPFLRRDLRRSGILEALPHVDDDKFLELARSYGVSTQALTLRLVNLGVLQPDPEI